MALAKKLLNTMQDCAYIGKDGYNNYHGYAYASAPAVMRAVNASLVKNGVVAVFNSEIIKSCDVTTKDGKIERYVEVKITYLLIDADNPEDTLVISANGSGQDATDKAVAKAETMAAKYAWTKTLLVADASDDPDSDGSNLVPTNRPGGAPISKPASNSAAATNGWSGDGKKIVGKCEKCGKDVNEKSAYYSRRLFGEHLYCYDCQQKLRQTKTADAPF